VPPKADNTKASASYSPKEPPTTMKQTATSIPKTSM